MIEIIIEPAQFLIDALRTKTAQELLTIIEMSKDCDRLYSVSIHLTAIEILMTYHPDTYELFLYNTQLVY